VPTHAEQRARTRRSLVEAATAFLGEGQKPTIEEVAERAGVSRATAYRHFPGIDDLLWQVVADRATVPLAEALAGLGDGVDDVEERVARCEDVLNAFLMDDPVGTRAFERSTLQRWLEEGPEAAVRPGRRLVYIDEALAPLAGRVSDTARDRLRNALAVAIGTHATIALGDVCGLDRDDARQVTAWMVRALVRESLRAPDRPATRS
jgi:AcrR family transcriptional regulator